MVNFKTYEDFVKFLKENNFEVYDYVSYHIRGYNTSQYFYVYADVSGVTGGSCYETETYEYENESPTYDEFYRLVELIFSVNEYDYRKREIHYLIEQESFTEHECYGNSSTYEYLILDLKKYYNSVLSIKEIRKQKLNKINSK